MADVQTLVALASSARAVTEAVLDIVYPGTPTLNGTGDADITPFWELTNLMINPSVLVTTLGYTASTGTSAVDFYGSGGALGTSSALRWTPSGTGRATVNCGKYTASAGTYYVASAYVRSGTTARDMRFRFNFYDSENGLIRTTVGTAVTDTTTDWSTRIHLVAGAPKGTARVEVGIESVSNTAGQFQYADCFMFHEANLPSTYVDYFDGTIAPTGYTTAWEDAASQWQGDDTVSLDSGDNLDGVVVRYAWVEQRTGNAKTKTDTAGTAGNVYVLELAQPYPGPGTAAAILARRGGTGSAQTAEVILDYSAETGAPIVYTLPGVAGLGILGQCTSIDFDMRSGFMRATAGGTVD
jgi:hypothetical protein